MEFCYTAGMRTTSLDTTNPAIHLIEPNIERDAPLGVTWLEGDIGRNTLKLMGVPDGNKKPSSLEQEKERVAGFISSPDQLNWMIRYEDKVVGAIWVDLIENENVPAPSIHLMVGDPVTLPIY